MWYEYTVKYGSATQMNEIVLIAGKWMALEIVMLSETSPTQKDRCQIFSLTCRIWGRKRHKSEREAVKDVEGEREGGGVREGNRESKYD
jgi:hypothetical protein